MRKILFLLFSAIVAHAAFAQTVVFKPYSPPPPPTTTIPTPDNHSTAGMVNVQGAPQSSEADSRRTAAIQKVRNGSNQADQSNLRPTEYGPADYPATYEGTTQPATTTMTLNGAERARNVRRGIGQEGTLTFTPIGQLHFVQFSVYCKNTPVNNAWDIPGLWLIWHAESKCPSDETGAAYIVKGYRTPEEAKAAVLNFKSRGIDCWYNPVLSNGTAVEIIGVF